MANIVNLYAETGANMISDDTSPALTLQSTTNVGGEIRGGVIVSTASIDVVSTPEVNASTAAGVLIRRTNQGNMTNGVLRLQSTSVASGAMIEIVGASGFVSITSTVLTTVANTDYALRVTVNGQARWIPLFKDAAIIGAGAFA